MKAEPLGVHSHAERGSDGNDQKVELKCQT